MALKNTDPGNQRRNVAVAAEVFLDYGDFIRKVIRRHVQDEDRADDLFQGFFISFTSYRIPSTVQNVESYLYRSIANAIFHSARQKERYTNCIHEYAKPSNHLLLDRKTPEEAVLEREEVDRVFELIEKRLPPTEGQAVALPYQNGHNAKEIAKTMKWPVRLPEDMFLKGSAESAGY